jgi:hypothetical protein
MAIQGIGNMTPDQLRFELQRGAKLVRYQYCISALVITFRRSSEVYYIPAGESAVTKGLQWSLLTLVAGWWGIPWGPIFSIQSLYTNFKGGKDLTAEITAAMNRAPAPPTISATSTASSSTFKSSPQA